MSRLNNDEFVAHILEEAIELLDEGAVKTSKKRKLDNYLAKYNYKGDKKSGTIEVDGKTYNIDRDTKSDIMSTGGKNALRSTAADLTRNPEGKQIIHLDKNFEKLKNNKRRDAVLQHEIGHLKLHSMDIDSEHLQKDRLNKSTTRTFAKEKGKIGWYDAKEHREMQKSDRTKMKFEHDAKDIRDENKKSGNSYMQSERDKNIGKYKKYDSGDLHVNTNEFEADKYSAEHTSLADRKRSLRETRKHERKNVPDYNLKNWNNQTEKDYLQRSKALKDKTINGKVYSESIEYNDDIIDIFNETENLFSEDMDTLNEGIGTVALVVITLPYVLLIGGITVYSIISKISSGLTTSKFKKGKKFVKGENVKFKNIDKFIDAITEAQTNSDILKMMREYPKMVEKELHEADKVIDIFIKKLKSFKPEYEDENSHYWDDDTITRFSETILEEVDSKASIILQERNNFFKNRNKKECVYDITDTDKIKQELKSYLNELNKLSDLRTKFDNKCKQIYNIGDYKYNENVSINMDDTYIADLTSLGYYFQEDFFPLKHLVVKGSKMNK